MDVRANRKYKDSLFRDLFGSPERKEYALELYNALNGTRYADPGDLELTTLDDVVYLGVRNDVSFLLAGEMVLWEHQSTPNPNMPLRGLGYFSKLYSAYIERAGAFVYREKPVSLPTPRYVVIYAGVEERPEREVLRLSDLYAGEGDVEVRCEVVNVNVGQNVEIAEASPVLADYARFVADVREYNCMAGMTLEGAVDAAIDACIERGGPLAGYLRGKRAEVYEMFLLDYDEEHVRLGERELGREEGREEGRDEMRGSFLARAAGAVASGRICLGDAAEAFGFTEEEIRSAISNKGD